MNATRKVQIACIGKIEEGEVIFYSAGEMVDQERVQGECGTTSE